VGHRDIVTIDRIVNSLGAARREVGDELVPLKVPIHPSVGAAALLKAENFAVEVAGGGEVVDGHRKMKARNRGVENGHVLMLRPTLQTATIGSQTAWRLVTPSAVLHEDDN
jgi:hypothetical protein